MSIVTRGVAKKVERRGCHCEMFRILKTGPWDGCVCIASVRIKVQILRTHMQTRRAICNPSAQEAKTGICRARWLVRLAEFVSSGVSKRPCLEQSRER